MAQATVCVLLCLLAACAAQNPIVDTEYGQVEGKLFTNVWNGEFSADVHSFHGVPYAKSTDGPRRFRNPEKRDPWAPEIYQAFGFGQACPQSAGGLTDITHPGFEDFGEDCLNMDIYTPAAPGSYPVLVWFHGGAYQSGTNIQYPGHYLATRGVVSAIVNYRLGYFGFAYTGNDACPGNAGLFDQRMSLEFVRDNIANFGGDPTRVTISGQSAGASSTGLHVVSPMSQGEGLFHQAILESGTEWNFWSLNMPESHPENYIRVVAAGLNCSEGFDDYEMMDCLRELPWQVVRRADFDCTPGWYCLGMAPVVDGYFLPDKPRYLREAGSFLDGPMITGITEADGSWYTLGMIPESADGGFNHTEWLYHLETDLMSIWEPLMYNDTYQDIIHAVEFNYSPWPYPDDEYWNRNAFNELITDAAFGNPWNRQMIKHSETHDIYGYVFGYRGRTASDLIPEWMGVPHMGELPASWSWTLLQFDEAVRNDSGIMVDIIDWTDEDVRQTIYWNKLYANFISTGNPTPTPVADPLGGATIWRPYTVDDRAVLYVYNISTEVVTEWEQKDYAFWEYYAQYILSEEMEDIGIEPRPLGRKGMPAGYLHDIMSDYFSLWAENRFD